MSAVRVTVHDSTVSTHFSPDRTPETALPWQDDAVCAQTDPEAFFPEKGGTTKPSKSMCAACPVAAECLEYALANEERYGIWGGLSVRDRRPLLRARKAAAA